MVVGGRGRSYVVVDGSGRSYVVVGGSGRSYVVVGGSGRSYMVVGGSRWWCVAFQETIAVFKVSAACYPLPPLFIE